MNELPNQWKHPELPSRQLSLNIQELNTGYPPHWNDFLSSIKRLNTANRTLYDLGCGVGSLYKLIQDNRIALPYVGIDFSEKMIETAKQTWKNEIFHVGDVFNSAFSFENQIIHCSGLLDILPNGKESLERICKMNAKYILLSRLNFGDSEKIETYTAYNLIDCVRYTYSKSDFLAIVSQYGYIIQQLGSMTILTRYTRNV